MSAKITIEQLCEQLKNTCNVKMWQKGDIKRIYLKNIGYNTNKMRTTTFIYQTDENEFKVSCYVECPYKPTNWINSQKNEFIESTKDYINDAAAIINNTSNQIN